MDLLEGIEKEPDEVKFKGIDIAANWLEEEEKVIDISVYAYEKKASVIKEFDLENIKYIDIIAYDQDYGVTSKEEEWEMPDSWETVKLVGQESSTADEVTGDLIYGESVGTSDPNSWIKKVDRGQYRVGIENGDIETGYLVTIKFETDANRIEKIYFPIEIVDK